MAKAIWSNNRSDFKKRLQDFKEHPRRRGHENPHEIKQYSNTDIPA